MIRHFTALFAVLAIVAGVGAQDKKPLSIRWHGQSFFEITSSAGTRIVLDPHNIEAFGRDTEITADLVILSHFHNDHTQVSVLKDSKKAKVLTGLKDEKGDGKRVSWNNLDEKFKDVHIRSVGTYHDDMSGMKRGLNSVTILEVDGYKIAHLGDLGHTLSDNQLKQIGEVDVLMIPVGGVYTLNGIDAKRVVEQIKPKHYVIPMHYGIEGVYTDLLTTEAFLEEQKNVIKEKTNELKLEPGAKPPAELTVLILKWASK
jgi:L-ascorbate metabolism protein UlaG (beta-lactamase superfamily)